jgi:hypothetical protein
MAYSRGKREPSNAEPPPRSVQEVDQKRKCPKAPGHVHIDLHVETEGEILSHLDCLSGSSRDEAKKVSPLSTPSNE